MLSKLSRSHGACSVECHNIIKIWRKTNVGNTNILADAKRENTCVGHKNQSSYRSDYVITHQYDMDFVKDLWNSCGYSWYNVFDILVVY
ncbi:MAG TPA: hypothetical protein P5293_01400 [Bacteroidales bacterium]|nr:hypothetical protein [Bacteroidales bacterium]